MVAEEVRNLAKRTQDSTGEINKILNLLVSRISEVTASMDHSLTESSKAIELAGDVMGAFEDIENAVQTIRDMTTQVATATEEQSSVTEDVTRNAQGIADLAHATADEVRACQADCQTLSRLAASLRQQMERFQL